MDYDDAKMIYDDELRRCVHDTYLHAKIVGDLEHKGRSLGYMSQSIGHMRGCRPECNLSDYKLCNSWVVRYVSMVWMRLKAHKSDFCSIYKLDDSCVWIGLDTTYIFCVKESG